MPTYNQHNLPQHLVILSLTAADVNEDILNQIESLVRQVSHNLGEVHNPEGDTWTDRLLTNLERMRKEIQCGPFDGPLPTGRFGY